MDDQPQFIYVARVTHYTYIICKLEVLGVTPKNYIVNPDPVESFVSDKWAYIYLSKRIGKSNHKTYRVFLTLEEAWVYVDQEVADLQEEAAENMASVGKLAERLAHARSNS